MSGLQWRFHWQKRKLFDRDRSGQIVRPINVFFIFCILVIVEHLRESLIKRDSQVLLRACDNKSQSP
ncbi:hypothetical protein L228DRAFT_246284 [Xylona heveae TC161]|uniref:Uncharacterized protein n=1 Tax=Xylona heveae (strain CBS 132557 / TC161) TaxID=1328760 RepID=A0A165HH87_XYLHT|nr:hypothetical protein L228DRAFT_246284 [Xylona heveae TC161]KZF23512.1 hypothetical protein L228DRAFT_246284 [Xylona heveae TC161]